MEGKSLYAACSLRSVGRYPFLNRHERDANFRVSDEHSVCRDADLECGFLLKTIRPVVETMSNQNSIIAADAKAAELDTTRAVYDMLKPLGCEAQTRVLDHVYGHLRAHRQSSEAQEQDEISSRV